MEIIPVTSLRLGNYVYYNGNELVNILTIDRSVLRVAIGIDPEHGDFLCSCDRISGIPLTEELLLKMGFEKASYDAFWYKLDLMYITIDGNELYYEHPFHRVNLKYIHQLQNLTFILTGQELTLS